MKEMIQRTFVRQEAYLKLRDWIVEGVFKPGEQLRDKELAEKMGVSRTPIREALLRLESEGLVSTKPNCSTLVSPIDLNRALGTYSIVSALEQLALTEAFESMTNSHIEMMTRANERFLQQLKRQNRLGALEADNKFHSVFIELSNNQELQRILSELKQKLKRLDLYYFETVKDAALSFDEHQALIASLKQRDLAAALRAVENNWKASFSRFNPKTP